MKILILDDNPNDMELAKHYLTKAYPDATFMFAEKKDEFFENFAEWSPDLVVSDFQLLDCNGLEILFELRKRSNVPFIFLTGTLDQGDDISNTVLGGASAYIFKDHIKKLPTIAAAVLEKERETIMAEKQKAANRTKLKLRLQKLMALANQERLDKISSLASEIDELVSKI